MKYLFSGLVILAFILTVMGCSPKGFLFTKSTMPLDIDLSRTPRGSRHGEGKVKHIHYYVDLMWSNNSIGDIAKQNSMNTVYYADLETLSVLSIFNMYTVHIYGK